MICTILLTHVTVAKLCLGIKICFTLRHQGVDVLLLNKNVACTNYLQVQEYNTMHTECYKY